MPTPTSSANHAFHTPLDVETKTAQSIEDRITALDAAITATNGGYAAADSAAVGNRALLPTTNETLVAAILEEITARNADVDAEAAARTAYVDAQVANEASLRVGVTGLLGSLLTTLKTNLVVAINEVVTNVAAITANAWVTTVRIANLAVTGAKIDTVALAPPSIMFDPSNRVVPPGSNYRGKLRWYTSTNLSIDSADVDNPYANPTLVMGVAANLGGKIAQLDEAVVNVGDIVRFAARFKSDVGTTYTFNYRAFTAADAALGSVVASAPIVSTGTETYIAGANLTIPSTAAYVQVWFARTFGSAPLRIYSMWGSKGEYLSLYPPAGNGTPDPELSYGNLVPDYFNENLYPGIDVAGHSRWTQAGGYTVLVADPDNPYGGNTLVINASGFTQPGKKVYVAEAGLAVGEKVAFAVLAASAGGASLGLRCGFRDSVGALISSQFNSAGALTNIPRYLTTDLTAIPAGTESIWITTERSGIAATISIYAMWGGKGGPTPTPQPASSVTTRIAGETAKNLAWMSRQCLTNWRAKLTKARYPTTVSSVTIINAGTGYATAPAVGFTGGGGSGAAATATVAGGLVTAITITNPGTGYTSAPTIGFTGGGGSGAAATASVTTTLKINLLGDSWWERDIIRNPFNDGLKSIYSLADAGSGYVSIVSGNANVYNWTYARSGTWTESDMPGTASGVDGYHAVTTDLAATFDLTGVGTSFVLHYERVVGGGTLEYRQDDTGSWTSLDTDAVGGYTTLSIPTASDASHKLNIRIAVAGSQGVKIYGVAIIRAVSGVRINKLGNGSTRADQWAAMEPVSFAAGITALNADLNFILLGTNDRASSKAPTAFTASLVTIIDRIRAATPTADIVLVMPWDVSTSGAPGTGAYEAAMRRAAILRPRIGFLSFFSTFDTYATTAGLGLTADALHPNLPGGVALADLMLDYVRTT